VLPRSTHAHETPGSELAAELRIGVLFDRVLDAVIVATLSTGSIVLWNLAAEKLFGYSADEAIGQSIEMLMPPAIAAVHRAGLERYLRTGHGLIVDADTPVEMPARTRGGHEIRVELTLSELHNSRGERFAVAVARDAVRRKQLELTNLELVQSQIARSNLETALAARDELLDALLATLSDDLPPDELRRLVGVIADTRQLHRGELNIHRVDADLVDLVHAASDAARRRASARRILVYAPPSAPATVDTTRMRQILDLVLDEAIHACPNAGRIEIRLERVPGHLEQLSVRTGGPSQVRSGGPGLLLARSLMQRQGGNLSWSASSGGGFEVTMTFPASAGPVRLRSTGPARRLPNPPCFR
jgi:PAS domain S-box-containing protein